MAIRELAGAINEQFTFDEHEFSHVAELYGAHYDDYLFDPSSDIDATEKLLNLREQWHKIGSTVVFTSGVYDLIHHDHKGYLLHTKLAGAKTHFEKNYGHIPNEWDELVPIERKTLTEAFIASGELRLIVSVDGDKSVASRKGGKAEKGNSARPITGWITRARSVVDVTQPIRNGNGWERLPVADAVTIHGPQDFDSGPHSTIIDLASNLRPDVWTIFEESEDILSVAPHVPALGSVALRAIRMGGDSRYFSDPIIGKFSTTSIIARAKGDL